MISRVLRTALAASLLNLSACTTWTASRASLHDLEGQRVRLTTTDSVRHDGVLVNADSAGRALLNCPRAHAHDVIDTLYITGIEARGSHEGRSIMLLMTFVGAMLVLSSIMSKFP